MKYVKQKLPGLKSGINYDDLESEIARLEKERQSAEKRDSEKIDFKLIYLTRLVDHCQMIKDGTISPPKPRTDSTWSDDRFIDMYLEDQHWKRKEMGEERLEKIYGRTI